jgi:hypothetical protein
VKRRDVGAAATLVRPRCTFDVADPPFRKAVGSMLGFLDECGVVSGWSADDPPRDETELHAAALHCLHHTRRLHNDLPRDRWGYTAFFPDDVYNAYVTAFKRVHGPSVHDNSMVALLGNRYGAHGFVNRSVFPDGRGGWFVDDYGTPGRWSVELAGTSSPGSGLVIRTIDAFHRALEGVSPAVRLEPAVSLRIVDRLEGDSLVGFDPAERVVVVAAALLAQPRKAQVRAFESLGRRTLEDVLAGATALAQASPLTPSGVASNHGTTPSVLVISLAVAKEGRGRDYFHNKFTYRIEAYAEALRAEGADVAFVSLEAERELAPLLARYADAPADIVVASIYQAREPELLLLHELVAALRRANPRALLALEGPLTTHAKQVLALAPDVDVMVRGEIDVVLAHLCELRPNGGALTQSEAELLAAGASGGVFVRGHSYCILSRFDGTNVNDELRMVAPRRELTTVWYTEHGCPHRCAFCRLDTGQTQKGRVVAPDDRIDWLLGRLLLEVDPGAAVSPETLRSLLAGQAETDETIASAAHVPLRADTFVGRGRVEITVVSENALASRNDVLAFFRNFVGLGLQKYFKIKLADVTIVSLTKRKEVNRELVDLLRRAEIFFIGFGTDNLSQQVLRDLEKSFYDFDMVVAINEALLESGIPAGGIRHNLVLSSPESDLAAVKTSLLLLYLAPVYNSVPWMLGNGWGNSRNSKVHGIEGNLYKARDSFTYSPFHRFDSESAGGNAAFAVTDDHFVARATPEYSLRRDPTPLFYRDERIYQLCGDFAWPDFYRARQLSEIEKNFTEEDFTRALAAWSDSDAGREQNALARLLRSYRRVFGDVPFTQVMQLLKSHMVAGEVYSFSRYESLVDAGSTLPSALEELGVGTLVVEADARTRPTTFDAAESLRLLAEARRRAKAAVESFRRGLDVAAARAALAAAPVAGSDEGDAAPIVERMGYPDRQAFEYLQHLNVYADSNTLFRRVEREMRSTGVHFATAVESVITRQLERDGRSFSHEDYGQLVRTMTDYKSTNVFGNGGLLHRLASREPDAVRRTVDALVSLVEERRDYYFALPIVLALRDLPRESSGLTTAAYSISAGLGHFLAECVPGLATDGEEFVLGAGAVRLRPEPAETAALATS